MKSPLYYQLSEYDCGPTAMLNAVNFLFEREEISPVVTRNIMVYCLDNYGWEGIMGKGGTSSAAMMFLSNWLNSFGKTGQMAVSSRYLSKEDVWVGKGSPIDDALCRGGTVVVRVLDVYGHYVLLTGIQGDNILMFDSYYDEESDLPQGIIKVCDQPFRYNRIVDKKCFNRETNELYSLGPVADREAVILFNDKTKKTEERSIEYFI